MEPFIVSNADAFIRLGVAMLLGVVLGTERYFAHKTAGMRTYGMVSLASGFFVVISLQMIEAFDSYNLDPLRIASEIVTGVGFLGAGLIIFRNSHVQNLTTASGLWVAAGVGVASGFGLFIEAIFVTILTLIIMSGLYYLQRRLNHIAHHPYEESTDDRPSDAPHG